MKEETIDKFGPSNKKENLHVGERNKIMTSRTQKHELGQLLTRTRHQPYLEGEEEEKAVKPVICKFKTTQ